MLLITAKTWFNKRNKYFFTQGRVGLDSFFFPLINEIIIMTSKSHFVFTRAIFEQILILDNDLKYLSVTNTWKQKELRKGVNT